jgi:bacteriorhodopsin
MDIVSTAFATVIPINLLLFLHHIYYSYKYVANESEKLYYYLTSVIPLGPAVMYSFQLITCVTEPDYVHGDNSLDIFFKLWTVTNPLLLINLGRVVNVSIRQYLVLVFSDLLMYIVGFLAHKTKDRIIFWAAFSIGSIMFCIILSTVIYLYFVKKHKDGDANMLHVYKYITKFIIASWALYPTVFILFKIGIFTILECEIAFIVLDFLTKSVFSSIIIMYHRHVNRRKSMMGYLQWTSNRIIPLETILESSSTDIPDITDKN